LYLDNKDVFQTCRVWLLAQKLATVIPKGFWYAFNTEIMPRLFTSTKKAKKPLLRFTTNIRKKPSKKPKEWKPLSKTATYKWLNCLGFYVTKEKKGVYVDSHKRANVIKYQQNDFLPKLALLQALSTNYEKDANSVL
jgi:hypothetical protein